MGMDVMGRNAKNKKGEYFRNNVWWWHPLAEYCDTVASDVWGKIRSPHTNDGTGLGAKDSVKLAAILKEEVKNGNTAKYEKVMKASAKKIPLRKCEWCKGTGSRKDKVGRENGLDKPGGCNGCGGKGKVKPFGAEICFDVKNVKEFAVFVENSGGFRIC